MKSIGFKNFRRFENLDPIELAPMTFLLGANNSGKSTVVKGILTLLEYLKNTKPLDKLFFNSYYNAHIGTFDRALHKSISDDGLDDKIVFMSEIQGIKYTFHVYKTEFTNCHYGLVKDFTIEKEADGITLCYNHDEQLATLTFNPISEEQCESDIVNRNLFKLENKRFEIKEPLTLTIKLNKKYKERDSSHIPHFTEAIRRINNLIFDVLFKDKHLWQTISNHLDENEILELFNEGEKYRYKELLGYGGLSRSDIELRSQLLKKMFNGNKVSDIFPVQESENPIIQTLLYFVEIGNQLRVCLFGNLGYTRDYPEFEYIYAHSVSQLGFYSIQNTNDYLSKTIKEVYDLGTLLDKEFVIYWMKELEIGSDYEINAFAGEAFTVQVVTKSGARVELADMGMGAIQLMILLLRFAIVKEVYDFTYSTKPTIIIEEPEQNMHPKLQSKLADLFYEINQDPRFGCNLLVETHSEYLIRKMQILAARAMNPGQYSVEKPKTVEEINKTIKVYYFTEEGMPRDMKFQQNGRFEEKFDEGFYDQAGMSNLDLVRAGKGLL